MSDNSIDMLMAVARVLNRLPQPVVLSNADRLAGRDKLLLETIAKVGEIL